MDSFTNKVQFDIGFSETLKLKDNAVLTILDPIVMSHHTSVSNCFHYVVTVALSLLTDQIVIRYVLSYLCVLNLNHSGVHLKNLHC